MTLFWKIIRDFGRENQELVGDRIKFNQSFKDLVNKMWARDPCKENDSSRSGEVKMVQ